MPVVYSAAARRDLAGIARAIAHDNPSRVAGFVEELAGACEGLDDQPERFALVPGYEAKGYRRRPYGSYSIIYHIGANSVNVYRVLHGARNLHKVWATSPAAAPGPRAKRPAVQPSPAK